jgi:glycosyltransferase involved in cell wall biosynthesis
VPRIAVDLRLADRPGMERSGVGRYPLEVARALRAARPGWDLILLSNRPGLVPGARRTRWPTGSGVGRVAWLHAGSAFDLALRRADLWFSPGFALPAWWRGPSVVTVHDLVFMLAPELYRGRLNTLHARLATRSSARRAARVLCGSEETRGRLLTHLGLEPAKVVVTPYGVGDAFRQDPVRNPELRDDFLLMTGVLEPRKGLDVLLDALRLLRGRGLTPRLVVAGRPGWSSGSLVDELGRSPGVSVRPSPSDEELAALYRRALALVYPSRMEGFALPVAEAMASGCPVVASELGCIREYAGAAVVYARPGDPASLAEAIAGVLADPALRARMATAGLAAAEPLRWEATAEGTAAAIEAALGQG